MMASLYQSGASDWTRASGRTVRAVTSGITGPRQLEGEDRLAWPDPDRLPRTGPLQGLVGEQIADDKTRVVAEPKARQGHFDRRRLVGGGVEADGDEHAFAGIRRHAGIEQDARIVRRQKFEIEPVGEGGILASDAVELGNERLDVAGPVPVPHLVFVLLGIGVFL